MSPATQATLESRIRRIEKESGATRIAVAYHDLETHTAWSYRGSEWFHAASTIKVAVLLAVYDAIRRGELVEHSRVHVRNRFLSMADGAPFRVGTERDANADVHQKLGKTMGVRDLAYHMITTSSNLATNLLIDLLGVPAIQGTLDRLRIAGIDFRRGVEDERAWEAGINNLCTAEGLVLVMRVIEEPETLPEHRRDFPEHLLNAMLEILEGQKFNSGIPAGLPRGTRVAHKTGEISSVAHDVGLVYLPGDRKPYALAVLTEWDEGGDRHDTIAAVSEAVHQHLDEASREEANGHAS